MEIKEENAEVLFSVEVVKGKEEAVKAQMLTYFAKYQIEPQIKVLQGRVETWTTSEHMQFLRIWLEEPLIQGRGKDEMYVLNPECDMIQNTSAEVEKQQL